MFRKYEMDEKKKTSWIITTVNCGLHKQYFVNSKSEAHNSFCQKKHNRFNNILLFLENN